MNGCFVLGVRLLLGGGGSPPMGGRRVSGWGGWREGVADPCQERAADGRQERAGDRCQEGAADRCQEGSIGCIHIYISITYVGSMGGAQLCKSLSMSPTTQVTTLPLPTSVPSKDIVPRLTSWLKANLVLR